MLDAGIALVRAVFNFSMVLMQRSKFSSSATFAVMAISAKAFVETDKCSTVPSPPQMVQPWGWAAVAPSQKHFQEGSGRTFGVPVSFFLFPSHNVKVKEKSKNHISLGVQ
jgi:hypothetical protein